MDMEFSRRELRAIMFTDIKSFSSMMGDDENRTIRLVKEHRELFRSFLPAARGVERATAGDSFFVTFNSALEAVNCAMEIQQAFKQRNQTVPESERVVIRIGIHLGDVFYDDEDDDVFGESINIAARTEPLGVPGGICVTSPVYYQVSSKISCKFMDGGTMTMKNIAEAPSVFHLVLSDEHELEILAHLKEKGVTKREVQLSVDFSWKYIFVPLLIVVFLLSVVYFHNWKNQRVRRENTSKITRSKRPTEASVPQVTAESKNLQQQNQTPKIVILPFENLTKQAKDQWFSAAVADAIETKLQQVKNIQVLSRRQFAVEENSVEIDELIKHAGGRWIVTGSYQLVGEEIRIIAQVLDHQKNKQIVATAEAQGSIQQIFKLQDAISRILSQKLELTDEEKTEPAASSGPGNLEAYKAYALGLAYSKTNQHLKAIQQFRKAVALDPRFGAARRMLDHTSSQTEYITFLPDGQIRNSINVECRESIKEWTTDIGMVEKAVDLEGTPLEVYQDDQMMHVVLPDHAKNKKTFRFMLDILNFVKIAQVEETFWYLVDLGHYANDQTLNCFELPAGAIPILMLPLPDQMIVEENPVFLVKNTKFRHDPMLSFVAYVMDKERETWFYEQNRTSQIELLKKMSQQQAIPKCTDFDLVIDSVYAWRMFQAFQQNQSPEIEKTLEIVKKERFELYPFLQLWMAGLQKEKAGQSEEALSFYQTALEEKTRLPHLVAMIFTHVLQMARKQMKPQWISNLVMAELKRQDWYKEEYLFQHLTKESRRPELHRLIAREPDNIAAIHDLSYQDFLSGNLENALEWIDTGLAKQNCVPLLLLKYRIEDKMGRVESSLTTMEKISEFMPSNWMWLDALELLVAAERYSEALQMLADAKVAENSNSALLSSLSLIIKKMPNPYQFREQISAILDVIYENRQPLRHDFFRVDKIILLIYHLKYRLREIPQLAGWLAEEIEKGVKKYGITEFAPRNLISICEILQQIEEIPPERLTWFTPIVEQNCLDTNWQATSSVLLLFNLLNKEKEKGKSSREVFLEKYGSQTTAAIQLQKMLE